MNCISINKHHDTPIPKKLQPNFKNNFNIAYLKEKCNDIFGLRTKIIQQGPLRVMRYLISQAHVVPGDFPSIRTTTFCTARVLRLTYHETSRYIKYLLDHNLIFTSKDTKDDYHDKRYITYHINCLPLNKEALLEIENFLDKYAIKSNSKVYRNKHNFINPTVISDLNDDPVEFIADFTKGELSVFRQIMFWSKRSPRMKVSQGRLAHICSLSREYVNRVLSKFEKCGIISLLYNHKQVSEYFVSSFFTDSIRAKVSILFRVFPMVLMLSKPALDATIEKISHSIKNDNIYITRTVEREFTYARARMGNGTALKKEEERTRVMLLPSDKKKILEQLSQGIKPDNFPSETVRSIADIPLSKFGQVKLSAFPDFIIKQALQETRRMKFLKDPFRYLFSRCIKFCHDQNIKPEFAWVDSLKKILRMDESMSPVIVTTIKPIKKDPVKANQEMIDKYKPTYVSSGKELIDAAIALKQTASLNLFAQILMQALDKTI